MAQKTPYAVPSVHSGTYGHGSFGYQSDPPGTTMTLWHCGVWIVRGQLSTQSPGYIGNTSTTCMHRTRREARICPNRRAYQQAGEGTVAPTGQR